MVQWVKAIVTKPNDLSSTPETQDQHDRGRERISASPPASIQEVRLERERKGKL